MEDSGGPDDTRPMAAAGPRSERAAEAGNGARPEAPTGPAEEPGDAEQPEPATSRRARPSRSVAARLGSSALTRLPRAAAAWAGSARLARLVRAAAAGPAAAGGGFSRLTLLPVLLVIAWLLPAVPLLLAGSFALAPMLVISIPLTLVLVVIGLRQVPARWPTSAQAQPGPDDRAPWWSLLCTVAVTAGFAAWQILESSQQLAGVRDQAVSLQFGYWIAQHGSTSIPVSAAAFGGVHTGLGFSSIGFAQHGASLSPQFMAGLPSVLAAGFWAGGLTAALLVPSVLGALAVLTFAGLVGRLAGPRWAPAGAVVLALALPEQYASRSPFAETMVQVLLFGGLCLFIDSLGAPVRPPGRRAPWWRASPSPATVLAALGGLALGLTAVVQVNALAAVLPAIPIIGIMFVARKPQWLPFVIGLAVGTGYGLADGYVLARPYLDSLSSSVRAFGIFAGMLTAVTLSGVLLARYGRLPRGMPRVLAARPLHWLRRPSAALPRVLPWVAAALPVLALIGFAIRPYVQTARADSSPSMIGYVGYLQRVAGLPLDPRRLYAEDTLYWVIWYIGLPALLLGVFGLALLARRVLRALVTWSDPAGSAWIWALPLLVIGWVTVAVLWRPDTVPDQPWASRRLVPVVLPGLILAAVWAAAWLTGRASLRGAGRAASSGVAALSVVALLLPTALTTFGVGVTSSGGSEPISPAAGLAFQRTGSGELAAVSRLCAAIGPGASVIIVDPRVANGFAQLIRGECNTPTARLDRPSPLTAQPVVAGIERARRRPVVLAANQAQLAGYGGFPREILSLATTQDAHDLTRPPATTWPIRYTIWMAQPGGA